MFDLDHWQEIYDALSRNKLRTFLTAFGVFWGIFLLLVMLGSGTGLKNGVAAGFTGTATNSFFVWTRATSIPWRGLPRGRSFEMNNSDITAIRDQVPEAKVIAPRLQLGGYRSGNNVTRGVKAGAFSVMGDVPEIRGIQSLAIRDGRFLNHLDVVEKRKVVVIGTRVRDVLFEKGEEVVGGHIEINGVYFRVIGVFKSTGRPERAEQEDQTIYTPFSTFQYAFNSINQVAWFAITSQPDVRASIAEEKVLNLLKSRHQVAPQDTRAFGHFNMEEEYEKIQGLFSAISILVWIVGTGTLAAGAIGVSNIMLIIIKERTKELGIRRAVGATPWNVITHVVLEAVMLTTLAGIVGVVAGVGVLELVNSMLEGASSDVMFRNPAVTLENALQSLGILIFAGTLAGVIPAQRAVSVKTVDALRADT